MNHSSGALLRVGAWRVDPTSGQISRDAQTVRLDGRTMRLLLALAERAGQVVSMDELLSEVWSGVIVTPDSVYQAVASLRRLLGDDAKQPAYIATVPRLGYRMVAAVSAWSEPAAIAPATVRPARRMRSTLFGAAAALCLALIGGYLILHDAVRGGSATLTRAPPKSIAVLPFLDLTTQEMNEEYFADGMTEELIDQLSKVPGLKVPGATSSFFFKGKRLSIAAVADSLGVAYVLDGSVRKSGDTLRIAARLVRADDGYVVWSESYDRRLADKLKVQAEIAGEVTKALKASVN